MTAPINTAMAYHCGARQHVLRQVRVMINACKGKPVTLAVPEGHVDASRVSGGKGASPSSGRARAALKAASTKPKMRMPASTPAQPTKRSASPRRSTRPQPVAKKSQANAKRKRKALANTQADKRSRDSGNTTTLSTSGIDGKGLSINRVR